MTAAVESSATEYWRTRMKLPCYRVGDAARYARTSSQTVARWHYSGVRRTLSEKEKGAALSYFQLIEVAVVAALRNFGVSLHGIRGARNYVSKALSSEHPFAEYRFKSDGKKLWIAYEQVEGEVGRGKLLAVSERGQLAWDEIIGRRLREFEYGDEGVVITWHVRGLGSPITIDPRVGFGAPVVNGAPTWILKGRWEAGESIEDIAEDFGLDVSDVKHALEFEGVKVDLSRTSLWIQ